MKTFLALFFLCTGFAVMAQEEHHDPDLLEAYRTFGGSQKLPIYVSTSGEISFFKEGSSPDLSISPTIHLGVKKSTLHYLSPVLSRELTFQRPRGEEKWVEYRSVRMELGLGGKFTDQFHIGLLAYKGSFQTTVRAKNSREQKLTYSGLPQNLSRLQDWREGDQGHYQTYGGIMISGRLNVGGVSVVSAGIGLQNQFLIGLRKTTADHVEFTINEENLFQRQVKLGPSPINLSFMFLQGQLFKARFSLDLKNPSHHQLYREALKGNVQKMQETLVHVSERLTWRGRDVNFYYGLPSVAGEQWNRSDFIYGQGEEELYVEGKKTKGELTIYRYHQNYVYQNNEGVTLFWTSKMKKVDFAALKKRFLDRARMMGLLGFGGEDLNPQEKFGSVITHLGIAFTKQEWGMVTEVGGLVQDFRDRCELLGAACAKEKHQRQVEQTLLKLMQKPWREVRRGLGRLLLREPALIYAFNKRFNLGKRVYFKFLSGSFRSLEGTAPLSL